MDLLQENFYAYDMAAEGQELQAHIWSTLRASERIMNDAVLAEYVRDGVVESVHRGYVVALNSDGSVNLALGTFEQLIFPRSTIKSIQGAAMVRAGLKLEPRLLALGCSTPFRF
jgi:L-asparaginase II